MCLHGPWGSSWGCVHVTVIPETLDRPTLLGLWVLEHGPSALREGSKINFDSFKNRDTEASGESQARTLLSRSHGQCQNISV